MTEAPSHLRRAGLAYGLAAASAFLGACLLWHIQPMMARFMLPHMGGTAAVWTTALVFYQSALVIGYGYAHWISRLGPRGLLFHGVALVITWLLFPLSEISVRHTTVSLTPSLQVLVWLGLTIGVPYILLSATAPLTQALSPERDGQSPYRLFAWSNLGSILGLLAYPFWVEGALGLREQESLWFGVYLAFGVLLSLTMALHRTVRTDVESMDSPPLGQRLRWMTLSALGVASLMCVSDAIATDLTVTPVLWVLPLFVYLLSFVICFGRPAWAVGWVWRAATVVASGLTVWLMYAGWRVPWGLQLGLWCAILFSGCMLFHGELVRRRPPAQQLTRYYLDMSIGGALSGILVAIMAPAFLPMRIELHLVTLIACSLALGLWLADRRKARPFESQEFALGLCIAGGLCLFGSLGYDLWKTVRGDTSLYRSFYGTLKVKRYPIPRKKGGLIHLLDGRISHGFQYAGETHRDEPTSYFVPESGVGRVLAHLPSPGAVAVLGLGVGTLSTYARPGDRFEFYEINPDVVTAAEQDFTYLKNARGAVVVRPGDGRMLSAELSPASMDLIVVDAFTGDAIPAHLITQEALDMYWARLKSGGVLAINVSNRHADLWRVIQAYARRRSMAVSRTIHTHPSPLGAYTSDWMVMTRSPDRLTQMNMKPWSHDSTTDVLWTDDYAPLYPILRGL